MLFRYYYVYLRYIADTTDKINKDNPDLSYYFICDFKLYSFWNNRILSGGCKG